MKALLNDIFTKTIEIFFVKELDNILKDVNERNLCGRLAIYLDNLARENNLDGYFADPEYNRKQNGQIKTILDDEMNVININCDVILHSRGNNTVQDNLIAIEMKKSNRPDEQKISDKNRLRALTKDSYDDIWSLDGVTQPEHVCGYIFGFYMEINIRERECLFECYEKGVKTNNWIRNF